MKNKGIVLVDAVKYPINKTDGKKAKKSFKNRAIKNGLPKLIDELKELNPQHIIIILSSIYDDFGQNLRDAGLPIVNVRVRSPWYNPEIYKNELKQAFKLCD